MLGHALRSIHGKSVLLFPFVYLGQTITGVSSYVFTNTTSATTTGRGQNDKNNKMREAIIGAIINRRVPAVYYRVERWLSLKNAVDAFLHELHDKKPYSRVECIHAAGRGHNYDFSIVFVSGGDAENEVTIVEKHVEFKFNAAKVSDTPQFVSPMKPSQYLSASYEEYFYDNYMSTIGTAAAAAAAAGTASTATVLPDRAEWLKQIHNNAPACVSVLQDKYYAGCANSSQFTNDAGDIAFYELCKKLSTESIRTFITEHDLHIAKLSEYLRESQHDKTYMLFQPGATGADVVVPTITLQRVDPADYKIVACHKNPTKSRYECETESGKKINVLLRWKNGNGIAFPAFQIS